MFGKNLETLSGVLPKAESSRLGPKGSLVDGSWGSFAKAFEMAQINITLRGRLGSIWPLFELFKDKNEEHCNIVHGWLEPLVQTALEERRALEASETKSPMSEKTFIQHLAESTEGKPLPEKNMHHS